MSDKKQHDKHRTAMTQDAKTLNMNTDNVSNEHNTTMTQDTTEDCKQLSDTRHRTQINIHT